MGRLIDADKYMNYLRAEINSEADIIAKHIKEDDPIGTVKDCGRIGRLQGLQWNRNMLESDRFTVEAIPKNQYEARLKADLAAMLEDLDLQIDEFDPGCGWDGYIKKIDVHGLIQQKINDLKVVEDGKNNE